MHGLFILGTTGEAQSISYRLRHEMIKETCRINAGRLPVLVCISDTSIVESIHLAHVGAECGASAVVSAPPYYFAPGQPELAEFYEDLIPQLPLPIFLYNMPSHTKVNLLRLLFNALPVILRWWDSRIVRLMPFISSP